MPDLIAEGSNANQRWRRTLEEGRTYIIGRAAGTWATPWDQHISRRHAEVCWRDGHLHVQLLPDSRNPVFVRGRPRSLFTVRPGEHFVIGSTTFTLSQARAQISVVEPALLTAQRFKPEDLQQARFHHADQRIEVLSRLPDIISGATSDLELFVRLVNILLAGIPGASAVAIVAVDNPGPAGTFHVLHWDRRDLTAGDFATSSRLIRESLERRESVVHVWRGPQPHVQTTYTQSADVDWAFCTPVPGEACRGWGIYVAGQHAARGGTGESSELHGLRDDLKFTELAAGMLSQLRELRLLERRQAGLRQFFSPVVLDALAGQDPDVALAPREAEVSVMFCDLRGFSRSAEMSSDDLLGLLRRVSRALGVVTHHILAEGGVVGDFHGDAAMGFWGWPLPQDDAIQRACRAALAIRADFAAAGQRGDQELADFRVGIGVASGRAVAGKIGTVDQVKVTVFGPVVNLASRLESMTRLLRASILLDEPTAGSARQVLPPQSARLRRVARIKPFGLTSPLVVTELLPPTAADPTLSDENLAAYEAALDALLAKDWSRAFQLLHRVPAEDQVKDFLTVFIAQHDRVAPADWDGVIPLRSK